MPLKVLVLRRHPPLPFLIYDKHEDEGDLEKITQQNKFMTTNLQEFKCMLKKLCL
jgi:hypothetical protein